MFPLKNLARKGLIDTTADTDRAAKYSWAFYEQNPSKISGGW